MASSLRSSVRIQRIHSKQLPAGLRATATVDDEAPTTRGTENKGWLYSWRSRYWCVNGSGQASCSEAVEISIHHFFKQLSERMVRRPIQGGPCFRGIPDQQVDFRWAIEPLVGRDELTVIQTNSCESEFAELPDRVGFTRRHDIVIGVGLLQHQMHGANVIGSVAPVALGLQISDLEAFREAELDSGDCASDLARDKLKSSPRTLMVEHHPTAVKHAVGLAVVHCEVKASYLADPIRATRMERGGLSLRHFANFAKHLTRSRKIEFALRLDLT